MDIKELQQRTHVWSKAYRSKKERHPAFIFAHLHEEVSEAWKEWREGRVAHYAHKVMKHGVKIKKPEGVGAELADVVILATVAADELGIDLDKAIADKFEYLDARLAAKQQKKGSK